MSELKTNCLIKGKDFTVGELIDYLSQFDRNIVIKPEAEKGVIDFAYCDYPDSLEEYGKELLPDIWIMAYEVQG